MTAFTAVHVLFFSPLNPLYCLIPAFRTGPNYRSGDLNQASSYQLNKGREEVRNILKAAVSPEQTGFPFACQAAKLDRFTSGRKPEQVILLTNRAPVALDALSWLKLNRASWGIESGLHQRLDVSHLDDLSRVSKPSSMLFMGMFRRISNSLCLHWISKQKNPHHKTTTDFFTAMNANHQRNAIRSLSASFPSFFSLS